MTTRQSIVLTCAAVLSAAVVAVLLRVSQRLALRSPSLDLADPIFGAGHVWWITSAGLLLLIGAIAAIYDSDEISPAALGIVSALLFLSPALVFTSDILAVWVALSAALAGFYFALVKIRVALSSRENGQSLLWLLLVVFFAAAALGVIWAILFLE